MTTTADGAEAQFDLGMSCIESRRFDAAARHFQAAIEASPLFVFAHNNLGSALTRLGRFDEAAAAFHRAIELDPDHVQAYYNLGVALRQLGQLLDSLACFQRTVELAPDHANAYNGIGAVLVQIGRGVEAIPAFQRALGIDRDHTLARAQLMFQLARLCDWDRLANEMPFVPGIGILGPPVPPFTLLSFEDHPQRHRARSERFASENYGTILPRPMKVPPTARPGRLRIGYFSADFHDHATMFLAARMLESHDQLRFHIHAYSYGPESDGDMRQRLLNTVDGFRDISRLSDATAAEAAREDGIDIAIDLKGYTKGHRVGIFAHRAAPIQMTFLGYPGTLGAAFIDYLIADRIVVPDEQRDAFSEKLLYLPHCYQPNDDQRRISDHLPTRAEAGLPDEGFVFCCFNSPWKITPVEFDIWMNLLRRIPASVLWLLDDSDDACANLRLAARARGVDPDRLLFARKLPQAEHLARLRLAGLFLDTFTCNAHTTASDALWAGVPLVTKRGKGFAARVAASLLSAVGLDELITTRDKQYAELAHHLATNPAKLDAIRVKLAANRSTMPLFDTALFTRHIEAGYDLAHQRLIDGEAPADILVPAQKGQSRVSK